MVPLDTNSYVTIWCPTRALTDEDSVLTYATGSHRDTARKTWYDSNDAGAASTAAYIFAMKNKKKQQSRSCEKQEKPKRFRMEKKAEPEKCKRIWRGKNKKRTRKNDATRISKEFNDINDRDQYRYEIELYDRINVGDCIAHHGWLLHGSTSQ
eukprot:1308806-Ditylum_brightwellii.AAC.1